MATREWRKAIAEGKRPPKRRHNDRRKRKKAKVKARHYRSLSINVPHAGRVVADLASGRTRYDFTDAGKSISFARGGVVLTVGVHLEARDRWTKDEGEHVLDVMVDEVLRAVPGLPYAGLRIADASIRRTRG